MAKPSLPSVPAATARRLLLGAQGLLDDPRRKATADSLYELIERIGFVQIDSINVVERAQHLTLAARLQGYRPALLARLLERAAALRALDARRRAIRPSGTRSGTTASSATAAACSRTPGGASAAGPSRRRCSPCPRAPARRRAADDQGLRGQRPEGTDKTCGDGSRTRRARVPLRVGEVRSPPGGFHKVYDLTERWLPHLHAAPRPGGESTWSGLPHRPRAPWVATAGEVAGSGTRLDRRGGSLVPGRAARGEIARCWSRRRPHRRRAFAVADGEEPPPGSGGAAAPAPAQPFDPILRDRKRTLRLFGFDYRFEPSSPPRSASGATTSSPPRGERLIGRAIPSAARRRLLGSAASGWEPACARRRGGWPGSKPPSSGCAAGGAERFTIHP